jgi:hypothetical protein
VCRCTVPYIKLVGALFVLTLASAMPAVPSTSNCCSFYSFTLIPSGCAQSVSRVDGVPTENTSCMPRDGVRRQNALCACVLTPLPRTATLRLLCTLRTQPPPSHAAPASPRDFFFLMPSSICNWQWLQESHRVHVTAINPVAHINRRT